VVTAGNPKGSAASQIIYEAKQNGIKRVIKLDHSKPSTLPKVAKYKHGWHTFPGLGLYSHVAGVLSAGVNAGRLGKTLKPEEISKIPLFKPEEREPQKAEYSEQLEEINKEKITVDENSRLMLLLNFMPTGNFLPHPKISAKRFTPMYVNVPGKGTPEEQIVAHAIARHLNKGDLMAIAGEGTVRTTQFHEGPTIVEGNAENGSRLIRLSQVKKALQYASTEDFATTLEQVIDAIATKKGSLKKVKSIYPQENTFIQPQVKISHDHVQGKIVKRDTFGNCTTNIYPEELEKIGANPFKKEQSMVMELEGKHPNGGVKHHFFILDLAKGLSKAKEGHTIACPAGGDDGALTLYTFMGHAAGTMAEITQSEKVVGRTVRVYPLERIQPKLKKLQERKTKKISIGGREINISRAVFHGPLKLK
jgi:S-adenosylmethionine hydrolase